jgi:regulator of replication initiation timing
MSETPISDKHAGQIGPYDCPDNLVHLKVCKEIETSKNHLQDQVDFALNYIDSLRKNEQEMLYALEAIGKATQRITAERDEALAKVERQRERITYLEGATQHEGGTPLSKAQDEIKSLNRAILKIQKERDFMREQLHRCVLKNNELKVECRDLEELLRENHAKAECDRDEARKALVTPKSKRPARCSLPTCSQSSLVERLAETPKTAALADEIKRNNWQDWHNLEKMEEHAKTLERSENKLKHRIRQLLKHRGHVAAEISSENGRAQDSE